MNGRHAAALAAITALAAISPVSGAASTAQGEDLIPAWVKTLFIYYANDQITDAELITALQYLIEQNIIQVTTDAKPADDADRRAEVAGPPGGLDAARAAAALEHAVVEGNAAMERFGAAAERFDTAIQGAANAARGIPADTYAAERIFVDAMARLDTAGRAMGATAAVTAALVDPTADIDATQLTDRARAAEQAADTTRTIASALHAIANASGAYADALDAAAFVAAEQTDALDAEQAAGAWRAAERTAGLFADAAMDTARSFDLFADAAMDMARIYNASGQ